ncbi:MAG: ATP-binding protein [Planctomycetota bacterium]|nr:MAG: ATP-binding protein [Planctomycetota bacterium]
MITRDLAPVLRDSLARYPIVTITGSRQAGKTTLARAEVDKPYANLEAPDIRAFAQEDPRGFLGQYPQGAILDEVQQVPELLSYLQVDVDALAGSKQHLGRWVLTGSHQPQLRDALAQSLAGRTALLQLMPLSLGELAHWQRPYGLDELLVSGCYPRLHDAGIPAHQFHADYVGTYLERDVRHILRVADLGLFQRFLGFFAGRHGQPMNYAQLAADVGIDQTTAKAWCGVLEASHVAMPLRPWFANIGKRLAKSPKWYLCDSGLAAHLIGVTSSRHLATHSHRGHLFEGLMVSEASKVIAHAGSPARCHVFSTPREEVDLLVEANGKTLAIEIKSGATVASDWFKNLKVLTDIPQMGVSARMVVYGGNVEQRRSQGHVCPWWLFPLRLSEWLQAHDALPIAWSASSLEQRLRASYQPGV